MPRKTKKTEAENAPNSREILNYQEIRFCERWMEHGNATRAYQEAGFPPVKKGSDRRMASRLFNKPEICKFINELSEVAKKAVRAALVAGFEARVT